MSVLVLVSVLAPTIRDLDGRLHQPFAPSRSTVLVFVASDCPIANGYAPEIQNVCRVYGAKGVDCLLLYEDAHIDARAASAHRLAYRYSGVPAAIDANREIAVRAGATITPEAAVVDASGTVRYLGRIDDLYVELGRRRPAATTHDLRDAIEAVLGGRPIGRPRTEAVGCYIAPPLSSAKDPR